jgi:4-diphosphocytidyl-2-C-methyl-D-erythritol kinase
MLFASYQKGDTESLRRLLNNTLENVLLGRIPILKQMKDDFIKAGAEASLVSGSGPTVFAITRSKREAQRISRELSRKHKTPFVITSTQS